MLSRTAMSGPSAGSRMGAGFATRTTRSLRMRRASRTTASCGSFPVTLPSCTSRSRTARSTAAASTAGPPDSAAIACIPSISAASVGRTMKSAPRSMNACTGACTARPMRFIVRRRLLPVRSGFCSLPESANSFLMIARLSRNHVYGQPRVVMCCNVRSVSAPGMFGKGSRSPVGESQRLLGPGRMRMPCAGQMGLQFRIPSV